MPRCRPGVYRTVRHPFPAQNPAGRRNHTRPQRDTVRITDTDGRRHKVRLAYIDAPEIGQAHGIESRDRLRRILSDETVDVQVTDTDRYGREVAYLFSDGLNINLS